MIAIKLIIIAVISYLLGSVNFGIILSHKLQRDDVRNHGSGNAGSTNMLRNYGKGMAFLTIIGDMAKVAVAIFIARAIIGSALFADYTILLKSFAGLFCVIGHIYPIYFKFKGGKGVATSGGMVFLIDWRIALILLVIFFIAILITKWVSLGSILMAIFYPIFIFVFYKSALITIIACVFAAIVLIAHRHNIVRILKGTERKITSKNNKVKKDTTED